MTVALKKQADALVARLRPKERVELAEILYASVSGSHARDLDHAWEREVDRRLDEYEQGKVKTVASGKVHAQVRRRLNEIKARRLSSRRAA